MYTDGATAHNTAPSLRATAFSTRRASHARTTCGAGSTRPHPQVARVELSIIYTRRRRNRGAFAILAGEAYANRREDAAARQSLRRHGAGPAASLHQLLHHPIVHAGAPCDLAPARACARTRPCHVLSGRCAVLPCARSAMPCSSAVDEAYTTPFTPPTAPAGGPASLPAP